MFGAYHVITIVHETLFLCCIFLSVILSRISVLRSTQRIVTLVYFQVFAKINNGEIIKMQWREINYTLIKEEHKALPWFVPLRTTSNNKAPLWLWWCFNEFTMAFNGLSLSYSPLTYLIWNWSLVCFGLL